MYFYKAICLFLRSIPKARFQQLFSKSILHLHVFAKHITNKFSFGKLTTFLWFPIWIFWPLTRNHFWTLWFEKIYWKIFSRLNNQREVFLKTNTNFLPILLLKLMIFYMSDFLISKRRNFSFHLWFLPGFWKSYETLLVFTANLFKQNKKFWDNFTILMNLSNS